MLHTLSKVKLFAVAVPPPALLAASMILLGSFYSQAHAGWTGPVYNVGGRFPADVAPLPQAPHDYGSHAPTGGGGGLGNGQHSNPTNWSIDAGGSGAGGTITATFTWVSSGPGDNPPETQGVLVHGSATIGTLDVAPGGGELGDPGGGGGGGTIVSGTASDGLGDDQVGNTSEGWHFKIYEVSNGQFVTSPVSLSASTSVNNPQTSWTYTAAISGLSVKLFRGGRYERSQLEGGDWHTYGDSIYSAHDTAGFPAYDFKTEVDINVGYEGNWGALPDGTQQHVIPNWTASGFSSTFEQSPYAYRGYAAYGTPTVSTGAYSGAGTGPHSFATSYTATNTTLGAASTAFYHLTLHDPIEPATGDTLFTYHVKTPMLQSNGLPISYSGPRTSASDDITYETATSEENGIELSATIDLNLFKDLLGLSATVTHKSTVTFSVTTKSDVPDIPEGQFIYRIADHSFQRCHKRFWRYDVLGKIKRMVTRDYTGATFNPPIEAYHEAITDTPFLPQSYWSLGQDSTQVNLSNLPHEGPPEKTYDFSGEVA